MTAVCSYFILSVGLSTEDTSVLVVSFCGVVILVLGDDSDEGEEMQGGSSIVAIVSLLILPFVSAAMAMTQRQMREVSEYTIGSYIAYAMVGVFGPLCLVKDEPSIVRAFQPLDWLLVLLLGAMSSWVSLFRSKSYQYEEPARLAVVNYFQPVL